MKTSKQGSYSITSFKDSKTICNCIIEEFVGENPKNITITDMTAGNGGDSITFARMFKFVNAIEIDEEEFEYLKYNVGHVGFLNIKLIHGSCLEPGGIDTLKQDVLYMDPPWGGPGYKAVEKLDLFISDINIIDISKHIIQQKLSRIIAIKVPKNYDIANYHNGLFNTYPSVLIKKININKYDLIIVTNY